MGDIIVAAWRVFGPIVLTWTVKQLVEWASTPAGAHELANYKSSCRDTECIAGSELDPDDGCFYWDLPTREQ